MELSSRQPGDPSAEEARHPIQVVARRTGLSADVIRVWERRYGAVAPKRVAGGRRLYSDNDIKRLALLQEVTSAGRRISEAAELTDEDLAALIREDRQGTGDLLFASAGLQGAPAHVQSCLRALREMDPERLRRSLAAAEADLPLPIFLEEVVSTLMRQVGHAWEQGRLRICQEHMASVVVRHHLFGLLRGQNRSGPVILLTTPAGQQHEIGALVAAITAESEGWRALYLGPNLPAAEIAAAAIQWKARAVGLSLQCVADDQVLSVELRQLVLVLPPSVSLIVGGSAAGSYRSLLAELAARTPVDLAAFRQILSTIGEAGTG